MQRPSGWQPLKRTQDRRRESTEAEKLSWRHLRNRQVDCFKFRRQVWWDSFIADFYYAKAKLVIEADGGQHNKGREADARRSAILRDKGFRVVRFWNDDVIENVDGVVAAVRAALSDMPSPSHSASPNGPLPLPPGERGL